MCTAEKRLLSMQMRSLLDSKYKLDTRITELKTKFSTVEKELEEKLQVHLQSFYVFSTLMI